MIPESESYDRNMTFIVIFLGMLTAFAPFVTDMYLPALPSMADSFSTNASMIQMSLTTCMIGLAVGQLIFGPMSDRYGRKTILIWTLILFIVSTVLCIYSTDIYYFVLFRLLQGIAAAGSIVIARSIATDMCTGKDLVRVMAVVGAINGIAPVSAPVIGGVMTNSLGWQGIFVVLLLFGIALLLACRFFQESLPVDRRSNISILHVPSFFLPLFKMRPFTGHMLQLGFAQTALFANIASAPFIIQQHYGFSPFGFSIVFGLNALVLVFSASITARFKHIERVVIVGNVGLLAFSVAEAIAMFLDCNFIVYECGILGILFSLGLCFTSETTIAMDAGRSHSGSASALIGAVPFAFGGLVSPLVGLGNTLHTTGLIFVLCAVGAILSMRMTRKHDCNQSLY